METRKILENKLHLLSIVVVIAIATVMRIVPHVPNFAPIGALALFAGYHLKGYKALFIPFGAMIISDFFLGFHETMFFVYGSFFIILVIGRIMRGHPSFKVIAKHKQKSAPVGHVLLASLLGSFIFFFITNAGVWIATNLYAHNLTGLMQSYIMGIPFFRNTVLGDLTYNLAFFYGVVVVENIIFY